MAYLSDAINNAEPRKFKSFNAVCTWSSDTKKMPLGTRLHAAIPYRGSKLDDYFQTAARNYTNRYCQSMEINGSFTYYLGDDTQIKAILHSDRLKRQAKEESQEKVENDTTKSVDDDKEDLDPYDKIEKIKHNMKTSNTTPGEIEQDLPF